MEFLFLKKDDNVVYLGSFPYKLANGQEVKNKGDELMIFSNVTVQKDFFSLKEEPKKEETKKEENKEPEKDSAPKENKKLEDMDKDELLKFAEENNLDVDKRKGEANLLKQIQELLK